MAEITSCCVNFYLQHCFNIHSEFNFGEYLKLIKKDSKINWFFFHFFVF